MYEHHLTNNKGNKIVVDSKDLNEYVNHEYCFDVEWYLSHGYSIADEMFKEIDNLTNNYSHGK